VSAVAATEAELLVQASMVEHRRGFKNRWYRTPSFVAGVTILGMIVLAALAAPLIAPHDPYSQNLAHRMIPPIWHAKGTWDHVLGTDKLGRD